jgi:hypothetical protein
MKNKLINEELKRLKLLMDYSPKNTLSENLEIIKTNGAGLLQEQAAFIDDLLRSAGKAEIKSSIEGSLRELGSVSIMDGKGVMYSSKNADEILKAMEEGRLAAGGGNIGRLQKSLFKNASSVEIKSLMADNIVSMEAFVQKYGKMTDEQMLEALTAGGTKGGKGPAYTTAEAEQLINKFKNKGGKTPIKPEPVPITGPPPINPPKPTWWESSWNWLTKSKWGRRIMIAGGLTAAYLLWKKLSEDDDDLPICLKNLIKDEEEFKLFLQTGYVYSNGYHFYAQDHKVKLEFPGGSGIEGTWSYDESSRKINMEFENGTKNSIPCENVLPMPDECPPGYTKNLTTGECEKKGDGGGGGGGSYKNCANFPFIKFCKNPKIAEVQECLGGLVADGKFGPKTESALEKAGYGIDISEDDYKKIMEKCKGVQPSPDTGQTAPETSSDMSNKPE